MGTFRYPIEIGHSGGGEFSRVEAWADSSATYTWIPRDILAQLGYSPEYKRQFMTADGRIIERDIAWVLVRIGTEIQNSLTVLGDEGSEPLLGAVTLEEFGLGVDSVNHTLISVVSKLLGLKVL